MKDYLASIVENIPLTKDSYRITLLLPEKTNFQAGQFAMLAVGDKAHLLRRPFAICEWKENLITICYQIKGKGTTLLSMQKAGNKLNILLPLGNGFVLTDAPQNIALVGGGVGIFPLIAVLQQYRHNHKKFSSFIGFRNKEAICYEDTFAQSGNTFICTDDGSYGIKGNVVETLLKNIDTIRPDILLACGPTPMLKALQQAHVNIPTYVSLEERMGCGIGACLVCVCKKAATNTNVRVCKDGPVFDINEIIL